MSGYGEMIHIIRNWEVSVLGDAILLFAIPAFIAAIAVWRLSTRHWGRAVVAYSVLILIILLGWKWMSANHLVDKLAKETRVVNKLHTRDFAIMRMYALKAEYATAKGTDQKISRDMLLRACRDVVSEDGWDGMDYEPTGRYPLTFTDDDKRNRWLGYSAGATEAAKRIIQQLEKE